MPINEEILKAALLDQKLEAYIDKMSNSVQDKLTSLPESVELEGWTIYCDHQHDTYMAVEMQENKKIIAFMQGKHRNTTPLMTEFHLTSNSNFALFFLQDSLLKQMDPNHEIILTGYKNGAAFAEILACKLKLKCFSFCSPGVERLLEILPDISAEDNKIIGIDGAPDDYNTRYGSISRRARLPIAFYNEKDAQEAREILKNLFASSAFISTMGCFLPSVIGGYAFPAAMAQFSGMSLAVSESIVEITNLNIHLKKIQCVFERMDARQGSIKEMIDILKHDVNKTLGLNYQIFEPKEWPKCKSFMRQGAEYLSALRCFEEFFRVGFEELRYMTSLHSDRAIYKDFLNESKNAQLKNPRTSSVSSLEQFVTMFYRFKEDVIDDGDFVLVTKIPMIASDAPAPALSVAAPMTPSWQSFFMQKSGFLGYFSSAPCKPR